MVSDGRDPSQRCGWGDMGPEEIAYHDERWCRPVHDDRELFAMLCLEGKQAGLSWSLILKREQRIRAAFDGFDSAVVGEYDAAKVDELMGNGDIIRNRRKIEAVIGNARSFQKVVAEHGSFDNYIWCFTDGETLIHHPITASDVPTKSPLSESVSDDLRSRGFRFVGPVIIYSYLQAIGIVNDHLESCPWKYR